MKLLGEVLKAATEYLEKKGIEKARREVEELFAHVLRCKRLDLYLQFDRPLSEEEVGLMREKVQRRASKEPLQYILGNVEFFGVKLDVSRAVLIPRNETEELSSWVAQDLRERKEGVLWDICCGAGPLGLSLKKALPDFTVVMSDVSSQALEVARDNAKKNGLKVLVREGDLLTPFHGEKADVIVCNPPYISKQEYDRLDSSVKDYEPKSALIGGEDGLLFYKRLALEVKNFLRPGGRIYLEIGELQGAAVSALFSSDLWKTKIVKKDLSQKDRFFFVENE